MNKTADQIKLANLETTLDELEAKLEAKHKAVPSLSNLRRVQAVRVEMGALLASMPADDVVAMMRR